MNNGIYDTIIIGSGPAGLTAGIYASRRTMKTLVIGDEPGGQIVWASEIENYPGFVNINNFDLIAKMNEQALSSGVEISQHKVKKISPGNNNLFNVYTKDEEFISSKTIILAMGLKPRKLFVPGEEELKGRGVSYCATCDSPFFKNKVTAVIGGGNAAMDAAELLSNISEKVYLIHRKEKFRAFETLIQAVKSRKNILTLMQSSILEIIGDKKVQEIKVADNSGSVQLIKVDGLFIEIGREANSELAGGWINLDKKNQIAIDDKCRTSHEGVFAAGDITNVPYKQIVIACGQGAIAALAAYEYLQLKK